MSGKYYFLVVIHCLFLLYLSLLLQWSINCGLRGCDISTPSRYQIQAAHCLDVRLVSMLEYWLTLPCAGLLPATHRYCELRGEIFLLPIDNKHYFTSQKHWQSCSSHNHPLSSTMLYEPSEEEQVIETFYLGIRIPHSFIHLFSALWPVVNLFIHHCVQHKESSVMRNESCTPLKV